MLPPLGAALGAATKAVAPSPRSSRGEGGDEGRFVPSTASHGSALHPNRLHRFARGEERAVRVAASGVDHSHR